MKKIIATTAVLASSVAFAGDYKMNLEGRYDFVNSKITNGTTTEKYNNFTNGAIRLNLLATVNDNLSFRMRYRFAKGAPTISGTSFVREESGQQLDYLYVDHKNSYFTTRFGKQNWVEAVGREAFVSATDAFVKSQAYSDYQTAFGSDYRAGVSAIVKMDTNTFTLAISNPNTSFSDSTVNKTNSGLALGVHYNGNFMNKLVQPVLSYQTAKQNGDEDNTTPADKSKDGNNTIMAFGLRSEVSGFTIDADYKQVKVANRNVSGSSTQFVETKTKSLMASVAYSINEFTPFASYINDKYTSETTTAPFKKNTLALGVMYKPMADVNFRYHLAYASSKKEKDGSASTVATTEDKKIIFGIKADI